MVTSALRPGLKGRAVAVVCVLLAFAVVGASGAAAHKRGTDRPWKGKVSGTSVLDTSTGAFDQMLKGHETHLGKVTIHNTGMIVPTGPNSFTLSGTGVVTAANGAELFTSFTGSGTNDAAGNVQGTTTITITGGTGRFSHASGSAMGSFSAPPGSFSGTMLTNMITLSFKGTISY